MGRSTERDYRSRRLEVRVSLIGRRASALRVASGMRALDFGEAVEGPAGDAGAIVRERSASFRGTASVRRSGLRSLRLDDAVRPDERRMLEQSRRISVVIRERGARGEHGDTDED